MKVANMILFCVLLIALILCVISAKNSKRSIGRVVAWLEGTLIIPLFGNMLLLITQQESVAAIGCYFYFIGMDLIMFALMKFAAEYCKGAESGHKVPKMIYLLLTADMIQILLNPIFHHDFDIEKFEISGEIYYKFRPYIGLYLHRILDYSIYGAVLLIFIVMVTRMPRIYTERYSIIMLTMSGAGLWQTFNVIFPSPLDNSTLGFAVFGMVIFYFSIFYRPMKLLDKMLMDIISEMPEALFVFDPNGKCIWINELGCKVTHVQNENFDTARKSLLETFGTSVKNRSDWSSQYTLSQGEEVRYYQLESHSVFDDKKRLTGSYLRIRDVTEEQQKIKREIYDSTHDVLTGLYTREYLYKKISELLCAYSQKEYLIIFVDVKNFKIVNDIFGSDFGDYALQCVAEWIRGTISEYCKYGRLAGDTFGICIPKEEFHAEILEDQLSHFAVKKENVVYQLLIHLGVYLVDSLDTEVSRMFDRAHLSLSTIRDEYKTHIAYYDNEIRSKILWNQTISAQLNEALATNQVRPYLQPIANNSGEIVGAEALARWIHPENGFMSPASFIPVFEKNGMIVEVDRHMWRSACKILAKWNEMEQYQNLFISVNISPKDFYFADVVTEIKSLVKEYQIEPCKLRIEITETVMMNDADSKMQVLEDFRKAGFIVEMDDFGSGYSSLNMLKDMPVDVLKIDMKFLGKTSDKDKAKKIVKNIIHLSEDLGISSLTEGVETEEQYQMLSEMGCKLFQGYYFSKPLPVEDFEKLHQERL